MSDPSDIEDEGTLGGSAAEGRRGLIDAALGEARPQAESAALVLARAKVAAALFGASADKHILGRFAVLDRLGTGGMGVVYAAYDTELDRRVALKMITLAEGDRAAALAEAKALAKLSHPNVVPVYDVGSVADERTLGGSGAEGRRGVNAGRVYIVMELVRGSTLGVWGQGRPLREVVAMYRQAAQGLAAAHAAGLVHRDFKPANAIVGEDGRLRVVDFGLATVDGGGRAGAGTAGYMAPEQATGAVTAAADQYSFAVTLGEAIPAPRPGWVEAVVARGSQRDPAQRYASMSDLVRALDRDPRKVWPRRITVGAIAGLAVSVGVLATRSSEAVAGPSLCDGADERIAAIWPAREAAFAKLAAASPYGAELVRALAPQLERYQERWVREADAACYVHATGWQSDALYDRRIACLDRATAALSTVAELAPTIAGANLARAVAALPAPEACGDPSAVERPPAAQAVQVAELESKLASTRVMTAAGRAEQSAAQARAIVATARTLGYRPLLADALLVQGHATMKFAPDTAPSLLREATEVALATHQDAIAIEAWARRAWLESSLAGFDVMVPLADRTPHADFVRALLHNNAGSIALAQNDPVRARAEFTLALAAARNVTGTLEVQAFRRNLALIVDAPGERAELLRTVRDELAALLGPTHPDVLMSEFTLAGNGLADAQAAATLLATTCERMTQHEGLAEVVAPCLVELGDRQADLGDEASAALTLAKVHSDNPEVAEAPGYAALFAGDAAAAQRAFQDALASLPPDDPKAPSYEHHVRAKLELGLGRTERRLGHVAAARAALERAAAIFNRDPELPPWLERRRARVSAELAAMAG